MGRKEQELGRGGGGGGGNQIVKKLNEAQNGRVLRKGMGAGGGGAYPPRNAEAFGTYFNLYERKGGPRHSS